MLAQVPDLQVAVLAVAQVEVLVEAVLVVVVRVFPQEVVKEVEEAAWRKFDCPDTPESRTLQYILERKEREREEEGWKERE